MKTRVSYIFTALVLGFGPFTNAFAQLGMKASLCNNHLWRGMEVSDGCVLTADAFYTTPNGLFTLGLWGGTNTQGTYKEFNHHLSLQKNGFQLALWDTYNFSPGATYNNREYFNYSARTTGRFLDATFSYRFQSKIPLLLSWSTIVFGRDRNADNTANKYSTFVYAEYPVYQNQEWRGDTGVGGAFALHRAGDSTHFFGTTEGIVHVSLRVSRTLKLGGYPLPLHAEGMWNPQSDKAYFQIGAQLFSF